MIRAIDHGEGILELRLDDAEGGNRLGPVLCAALFEALEDLKARPELKVVILSGRPEVFCAGAPREVLEALADGTLGLDVRELELPHRLLAVPVPVIAAMQGHAVGGGLTMALCCDMRVAATTARYGLNFADLGLPPGMGATTLLPMLMSPARAAELIMTAKLYRGRELADTGLFNAVVAPEAVFEEALGLARRLAEKPRYLLEMLKSSLAAPRRAALPAAMAEEAELHVRCFAERETRERIRQHYLDSRPVKGAP